MRPYIGELFLSRHRHSLQFSAHSSNEFRYGESRCLATNRRTKTPTRLFTTRAKRTTTDCHGSPFLRRPAAPSLSLHRCGDSPLCVFPREKRVSGFVSCPGTAINPSANRFGELTRQLCLDEWKESTGERVSTKRSSLSI